MPGMTRVIFLVLGLILVVLGLGDATIHVDDGVNLLLRDLIYVGAGGVLVLAGVAGAIAERSRQTPGPLPMVPTAPPPQQQPYPAPGPQQHWRQ